MTVNAPTEAAPKVLILPDTIGKNASIVTLAHPRTLAPTRYYFCPDSGIYEWVRITAPKNTFRSWLLGPTGKEKGRASEGIAIVKNDIQLEGEDCGGGTEREDKMAKGYVSKTAELFTATVIDSLFLFLPVLSPKPSSSKPESAKSLFLSADDLFENLAALSKHFGVLTSHSQTKERLVQRLESVCDSVEAGDEKMYRLSHEKLLLELLGKAKSMVASGLPASIEERFVRKALEAPTMVIKREESFLVEPTNGTQIAADMPTPEPTDSQSIEASFITVDSLSSTTTTTTLTVPVEPSQGAVSQDFTSLLRLRTALSYMLSAYLTPHLATAIDDQLSSSTIPIDFSPLTSHLAHLASLRAAALSSRSLSDFSHKRGMEEDDEAVETRAEKKRKKDEEEKRRKAGQSRGVKDLKKVDVKGMKKMSDFFGKSAAKKI